MNAHKCWGPALLAGLTWWGTAQAEPAIWRVVHKLNEYGSARGKPMRVDAPTPGSGFAWLQRIGLAVGAVTTVR